MMCILLTLVISAAHYSFLRCVAESDLKDRFLATFLLTSAQILLTEQILGIAGWLYLEAVVGMNLAVTALVMMYSYRHSQTALRESIKCDFARVKEFIFAGMNISNTALLLLVLLAYSWVIIAAYYLPLRGVDDLTYHLPPVFEYIQTHTIKLLPIGIRHQFAYPQNAELLFLWPAIFTHSQKLLDCINVLFVLVSIMAVFSLLRSFELSQKDSVFAALLYALCPVVLMQAGSNYIDVIVSLFFLLSLHFTIRYLQVHCPFNLYMAGLATGVVCGMKYTTFFLTIPFQLIFLWKLFTGKRTYAGRYYLIVYLLCGWWYLRNTFVLGSPFYPMDVFASGMGFMGGSGEVSAFKDFFQNLSRWILLFPLEDIGVGSFDGGFGLVFWGVGFPSWLCVMVLTLLHAKKTDFTKLIVLLQLPLGFAILLLVPMKEMAYAGRLSLFVVPIGLFALCFVFELINAHVYKSFIKAVCVVFSMLTVCLMSISIMPSYRLESAYAASRSSSLSSEYQFPMNLNEVFSLLRHIWYPLDYLTKDDLQGVNCYIASNKEYLALSPFYGSNLQNRPIAVGSDVPKQTDAYAYLHYPIRDIFGFVARQDISYPKSKITKEEMLSRSEYAVITQTKVGCLLMSKAYLNNPARLKLLRTYYGETWPDDVTAAAKLKPYLQSGVPVVTSNSVAYGLRYWELESGKFDSILLVPSGFEEHVVKNQHILRCYTFDKPLSGYTFDEIATVQLNNKSVRIFLNHVKQQA